MCLIIEVCASYIYIDVMPSVYIKKKYKCRKDIHSLWQLVFVSCYE